MTSGSVGESSSVGHAARYCVWCGHEFLSEARFCTACGRSVADSVRVPSAPPADWTEHVEPIEQYELERLPPTYDEIDQVEAAPPGRRAWWTLPSRGRRSWLAVGAAGVAALLVLGVISFTVYRSVRDRPVHQALDAVQTRMAPDMKRLESATEVQRLAVAGERFAADLPVLRARERELASLTTPLGRAGHRVLAAQVAFASAGAELGEVSTTKFTWWGGLHEQLATAQQELTAARRSLAIVNEDAAASIVLGNAALTQLEKVVGGEVAEAAKRTVSDLLDDLGTATSTGQVRTAARTAALETAAVETALTSMAPGSPEEKRLEEYAGILPRLGGLSVLDAEHLNSWAGLRAPLLAALARADSDVLGAAAGESAVDNVDRIVRRGRATLAEWKTRYDTAVEDRAQDLRALKEYRSGMDGQLATYSALRSELSQWVDKVADPSSSVTYTEAYEVLSRAAEERYTVRDKMSSLTIPPEVITAHRELISVVSDGIAAVDSAYEGASDSNFCVTTCYYRDTPGWRRFSAESTRITQAFQSALASWEGSVAGAERTVARRPLPKHPTV